MNEIAERCPTTRRPSRRASEAWRLYSQRQAMWNWSKGNLDQQNATHTVAGEVVAPMYPPQREPRQAGR